MKKWKNVLIIYDVSDNRNRNKVVRILESYGVRVQKSAFECYVDDRRFQKMKATLSSQMESGDSIRIYYLDSVCLELGDRSNVFDYSCKSLII